MPESEFSVSFIFLGPPLAERSDCFAETKGQFSNPIHTELLKLKELSDEIEKELQRKKTAKKII